MIAFASVLREQGGKRQGNIEGKRDVNAALHEYIQMYEQFINELFCLVTNIICVLDPDIMVIAGDLACNETIGRIKSKVNNNLGEEKSRILQREFSDYIRLTGCIFNCLEKINPGIIYSLNLDSMISDS